MHHHNRPLPGRKKFHVSLGHNRFTVESDDAVDALRLARQRMCLALPRLWDVISTLPEDRFRVDEAS